MLFSFHLCELNHGSGLVIQGTCVPCRGCILECPVTSSLCTKHCPRQDDLYPPCHLGMIDFESWGTSQILAWIHPFQFHLSLHLLPTFWGPPTYLTLIKTLWAFIQRKKHHDWGRVLITGRRISLPQPANNMDRVFKCWPVVVIFIYSKLYWN